jgi:Flp pilus assembly protein TadG
MTGCLGSIRRLFARFRSNESGVVMVEAILAVPLLTLLAIGVLEFGSILWQREQITTGLRDSVRYLARCRHPDATCDATARNLAYYGSVDVGPNRVPGWDADNSPITFTRSSTGVQDLVSATTTHTLLNSPLFGMLGIGTITVTLDHEQRDIGW